MSAHGYHATHPKLAHHFATPKQQIDSAKFGIWLFLAQEVLFFSALFVGLMSFRAWYPDMYHAASKLLSVPMGGLNTLVLILSSLTMALAVREASQGKNKTTFMLLLVTLICAGIFLVVKYFEYSHKIHEGTLPGKWYTYTGLPFDNAKLFFGLYFCLTGLHGIHVLAGMVVIAWMMLRARRNEFSEKNYVSIECVGLYWHLVDLVWIFLFPLLYLVG